MIFIVGSFPSCHNLRKADAATTSLLIQRYFVRHPTLAEEAVRFRNQPSDAVRPRQARSILMPRIAQPRCEPHFVKRILGCGRPRLHDEGVFNVIGFDPLGTALYRQLGEIQPSSFAEQPHCYWDRYHKRRCHRSCKNPRIRARCPSQAASIPASFENGMAQDVYFVNPRSSRRLDHGLPIPLKEDSCCVCSSR